jgi:PAS domain S-box-containing protein
MYATVTPAVTQALQGNAVNASSGAGPSVQFSKVAGICLFSLALVAIGARRSSWLVRAIQQERDVNRRIWDGASNGLAIVDLDLRVIDWNPAMERLTGVTRRKVLGTALTECPGFDRSSLHQECLRLAKQGIEIASDAIPADDGVADSPFRGYYSPLRNPEGEIGGVFAMLTAANAHTSQAVFRELRAIEAPAA